jgi:hypothetical protein
VAQYPCDHCDQRFQGAATRLYLNVFSDDATASFRFSTCPPCAEALADSWLSKAWHQNPRGGWDEPEDGETLAYRLEALSGPRNGPAARGRR